MSKKHKKFKVGDYVYMNYGPQNPGKVKRHAGPDQFGRNTVEIAWYSGATSVEAELHLKNFNALIADHQKKLNTHQSKLPKLAAL